MPELNDTQTVILAAAAKRDDYNFYPLPTARSSKSRLPAALAAQIRHGYAVERETRDAKLAHRADGDAHIGLFATNQGLAAIGIAPIAAADDAPRPLPGPAQSRSAKSAAVLDLLHRPDGASLDDLIVATGWLPRSTRAALTGLR